MRGTCDCCSATAELKPFDDGHGSVYNYCYICANTHVAYWATYPAKRDRDQIEILQEINLVANLILDKIEVLVDTDVWGDNEHTIPR
jgi:hypothetical protein